MKITFYNDTLDCMIQEIKNQGIKARDFNKIKIALNYDGCYYEGDSPTIGVEIPDELIKK